jgi:hypothetical protein
LAFRRVQGIRLQGVQGDGHVHAIYKSLVEI